MTLEQIKAEVKALKEEEKEIMNKYAVTTYFNVPASAKMRLRVIDDTIHGLKQQALKELGF